MTKKANGGRLAAALGAIVEAYKSTDSSEAVVERMMGIASRALAAQDGPGYDRRTVEAAMKAVEDVHFPDDPSHNLLVRAFKDRFKDAIRVLTPEDEEQD